MHSVDIAIVGAGPAGAILGYLLALNGAVSIALIDKRPLDRDYIKGDSYKCCGGLLSPSAQKALASLGLGVPSDVLVSPQLFSVKAIDLPSGLNRQYQRFYLNMDREKFDRYLAGQAVTKGATPYFGKTVCAIARDEDGFALTLNNKQGEKQLLHARQIVGADGAASLVRKAFFPGVTMRRYVSLQCAFQGKFPALYYSFFDQSISDYYAWALPKGENFYIGAALNEHSAQKDFAALCKKLTALGLPLTDAPVDTQASLILRPRGLLRAYAKDGAYLIGEAGGYISLSSAEGISGAIQSAKALYRSLKGTGFSPAAFKKHTFSLRVKYFLKNIKAQGMYVPWLRRLVLALGMGSIRVDRHADHRDGI